MSAGPCLLIRADASPQIGAGHAMRCLALAQAWRRAGGRVVFAISEVVAAIEARIVSENCSVRRVLAPPGSENDAGETAEWAAQENAAWIAVDGYHFASAFFKALPRTGVQLLLIDDQCAPVSTPPDLLLNQNAFADRGAYRQLASGTLLLGNRYTLLRSEFVQRGGKLREVAAEARRVLVTFGGADPQNVSSVVIRGIQQIPEHALEVVVLIGAANPHGTALAELVASSARSFRLVQAADDVAEWMSWADVAITAAGSTCWELALMQVPQLVVAVAENQRPVARVLRKHGAAIDLGWHADLTARAVAQELTNLLPDRSTRAQLAKAGHELIDGKGASRVALEMRSRLLRLRPANTSDCRLVWEWANESVTRAMSFSTEPIPWDNHCGWFAKRIAPSCRFYIAHDESGAAVGQARFDVSAKLATISTSVAAEFRGRGHGSALILAACRRCFAETVATTIEAFIKPENSASQAAFLRAGFALGSQDDAAQRYELHATALPEYANAL